MPLARSSLLPVIIDFAEKIGVRADDILGEIEVDPSLLSHPSTVVESSALIDAVAYAARASGQRDFGLRIATTDDPRALTPIGMVLHHGGTLGEIVAAGARYLHMHNNALNYELTADGPSYVFRLRLNARGKYPSAQYVEMCLALCARFITLLAGKTWRPEAIAFEHDREADPAAYCRTFRAPVRFAQDMNAIIARRADFDRPINRDDPDTRGLIDALADIVQRAGDEDIATTLAPVLRSLLATGDASAAHAAKTLCLSPRTLHRRLAKRGTTFQRVLDDVRLALVREHLPRGMKLTELAPILGLSEASAVSRFLRATGGFKNHKRREPTGQAPTAGE